MIYFITDEATERVKIGYTSSDPADRLRQLQTGSSTRLHIIAAMNGSRQDERALHHQLRHHHRQGEWFNLCKATLPVRYGKLWLVAATPIESPALCLYADDHQTRFLIPRPIKACKPLVDAVSKVFYTDDRVLVGFNNRVECNSVMLLPDDSAIFIYTPRRAS